MTEELFCFYAELLLPSISNSVDFRGSMRCIVLHIKLTDENFTKKLGDFIDGKVQEKSFCPLKTYKSQNDIFGVRETCTELYGTVDAWLTVRSPTLFSEM